MALHSTPTYLPKRKENVYYPHEDLYTNVTAALLYSPNWKCPKYLSGGDWINNCGICIQHNTSPQLKAGTIQHRTTRMNLKITMMSESSQTKRAHAS